MPLLEFHVQAVRETDSFLISLLHFTPIISAAWKTLPFLLRTSLWYSTSYPSPFSRLHSNACESASLPPCPRCLSESSWQLCPDAPMLSAPSQAAFSGNKYLQGVKEPQQCYDSIEARSCLCNVAMPALRLGVFVQDDGGRLPAYHVAWLTR